MTDRLDVRAALDEVERELRQAMAHHLPLNSPHEGWAVIKEEEDELWEHVRDNTGRTAAARVEAIQTAAMALRYAIDLTTRGGHPELAAAVH